MTTDIRVGASAITHMKAIVDSLRAGIALARDKEAIRDADNFIAYLEGSLRACRSFLDDQVLLLRSEGVEV